MLIKNTISESRNSQKINKGLMPLYRAPQRISQSLDPVNAKERLLRALWPLHTRIEPRTKNKQKNTKEPPIFYVKLIRIRGITLEEGLAPK